MRTRFAIAFFCAFVAVAGPGSAADPASPTASKYGDQIRPLMVRYCGECHDPEDEEDPVKFLRDMTSDEVASHRSMWSGVAEQIVNRTMPPGDADQPTEAERLEMATWIRTHLDATACDGSDFAGRPVPRRLNRDQYTYAIKDLTGVTFDFVETFPADGSGGEGFDNNGETLFLPPLLMERYLEVAAQVVDRIVFTEPIDRTFQLTRRDPSARFELTDVGSNEQANQFRLDSGAKVSRDLQIDSDADFVLTINAASSGDTNSMLVLRIDGIEVERHTLTSSKSSDELKSQIHLTRGLHRIELAVPIGMPSIAIASIRLKQNPVDKDRRKETEAATKRIFAAASDLIGSDDRAAAQTILASFARSAWRGNVGDGQRESLMNLFDRGHERGESFNQAIKLPLKAILVSPRFLFVGEVSHSEPGIHRISDLELASRLSLFLWHSLPDGELLELAQSDRLHLPNVLDGQVHRMLADDRSIRFADAFAGQWLGTVAVGKTVIPDTEHFRPVYTSELVTDLGRQVSETMQYMLRENRPVTDWLDCDYVVVNRRLAKHYGISPLPKNNELFEPVKVTDSPRPGVLGMGAVHMLTSYSQRTSPVLRGGWVLETIFGARLPAPPPDVPALRGGEKEVGDNTVRQRLEKHRENPTCAACHDLIDPIGFALENFDVLGRWRKTEGEGGKNEIDATGKLPSGETFDGPIELRRVLLARKDDFGRQISHRMLGFALGRTLEDEDGCTVQTLTQRLAENNYKIESLVMGIVQSIPFQYRQGDPLQKEIDE